MNATLKIFIFLFCCTAMMACSEDVVDKIELGTISGTVIKHGTNKPLQNVKISTAPTSQTIFSAEDGSFLLTELPTGDYAVKAEAEGYIMEIQAANIIASKQSVKIVFEMKEDKSINNPPSAAKLIAPIDNAIDQAHSVTLSWNGIDQDTSDILTYTLLIRNSENNTQIEIKDIKETSYTLENLTFKTDYFWQVVTNDGVNKDVFSETHKFTTAAHPKNRFHYVRKDGHNLRVLSSDQEGNAIYLTEASTNSFRPRKNNAANRIAFLRNINGTTHIFTSKSNGTAAVQITTIPVAGFDVTNINFSWSANGKELIYPNFDKLYRINKDGSGTELIYQTPDGSFISECIWSNDGSKIALKTNDINGYKVKIYLYDIKNKTSKTILENVKGAAGGLDLSVDGSKLIYTHDVSGYQEANYRQLNTHIFIHDLKTNTTSDLSSLTLLKSGYIDTNPRFSPNEGQIIFTQRSNDGISQNDIYTIDMNEEKSRNLLFSDADMPDWE